MLRLADGETFADLVTYVQRAKRADPDGAARLVGHGDVLALYVSPLHGGGGPDVIGLRAVQLAEPSELDVTVALAALTDRFPRIARDLPADVPVGLPVPPAQVAGVAWAGMSPPRRGWQPAGALPASVLVETATAGIAEVAEGAGPGSGAAAVAQLRARVWGRPLAPGLPGLPAGVAFAAQVLGFVEPSGPVTVYRCGPWWRVSSGLGHVLARGQEAVLTMLQAARSK
jgi:hypothetical protein